MSEASDWRNTELEIAQRNARDRELADAVRWCEARAGLVQWDRADREWCVQTVRRRLPRVVCGRGTTLPEAVAALRARLGE